MLVWHGSIYCHHITPLAEMNAPDTRAQEDCGLLVRLGVTLTMTQLIPERSVGVVHLVPTPIYQQEKVRQILLTIICVFTHFPLFRYNCGNRRNDR